jgi:hypothetical protein
MKIGCKVWAGSDFGYGPQVGFCEHGDEPLGSINSDNFLSSYKVSKKYSEPVP